MGLTKLAENDSLVKGQRGELRIVFKPGIFSSYQEDGLFVTQQLKNQQHTDQNLAKLNFDFQRYRVVVQPAPGEGEEPYVAIPFYVMNNPIIVYAVIVAVAAILAIFAAKLLRIDVLIEGVGQITKTASNPFVLVAILATVVSVFYFKRRT